MYIKRSILTNNAKALERTDGRFGDIYRIILPESDSVMCETSTTLRIHRITYREARDKIESLAKGIVARFGANDRYIGLYGENSPEWIMLFWAILRSGNRAYLINTRQPDYFTRSVLSTLDAIGVVSVDGKSGLSPCSEASLSELFALADGEEQLPEDAFFGNEIAITTSGTTLEEKICIYRGENFSRQLVKTPEVADGNKVLRATYNGKLKHLMFLPLYHIFGLSAVYFWFSFFGATFVFPPSYAPEDLLRSVRRHEVTHIFAVPLLWQAIEKGVLREVSSLDDETRERFERGTELSIKAQQLSSTLGTALARKLFYDVRAKLLGDSVKCCITGGSGIAPSAIRLINALGYKLYNGYGMSEIGITSMESSAKIRTRMRATIGRPFPFVEYRIGDNGHLEVRGDAACCEMIISRKPTSRPEWFDTGDIMSADKEGRYSFVGRATDVIISDNGENINPELVRQAFGLSSALNFEIIPTPEGDAPMLVIQLPKDTDEQSLAAIKKEAGEANNSLPSAIRVRAIRYTFDSLMREKDIKVSRTYLCRAVGEGRVRLFEASEILASADPVGEQSELCDELREMFARILDMQPSEISEDANFMTDLGGSSLDYYELIGEIDKHYGVRLPFEADGFSYSLRDFEKLVKEQLSSCMNFSDGSR